jgi:cbb3-type cytochrome oxidase maturation protein
MNILYLLIAVSLLAALSFLVMFIWAVKTGQFDDSYTPSVRILFDDDTEEEPQPKKE